MRIDELKKESKRWEQEDIINADQRKRILALYPEKTSRVGGIIFAGLGALLIGAGIILIFAFNWDTIPVPLKLCLAFLPLSAAIAHAARTILKHSGSAAFRETAGIFLALGVYAALALIGQTFHSGRSLPVFVLACSVMVLPGAYVLQSLGAAAIYSAGAIFSCWEQPQWAAFLVCAAIIPFFIIMLYRAGNDKNAIPVNAIEHKFPLGCTLLLFSAILINLVILFFYHRENNNYEPLSIALFCMGILFLLDSCVRRFVLYNSRTKEQLAFLSPPRALSQAALLGILLTSAAESGSFLVSRHWDSEEYLAFWRISTAMLIIAALYFAAGFVRFNHGGQSGEEASAGKSPLRLAGKFRAVDLYFIFCLALQLSMPHIWIASNVMLFGLGIYYIFSGGKKLRLRHLNFGMLLLIYLIALRFFDMDLSLLQRGIAFIVLGIVFLVCNVLMFRKKRGGGK